MTMDESPPQSTTNNGKTTKAQLSQQSESTKRIKDVTFSSSGTFLLRTGVLEQSTAGLFVDPNQCLCCHTFSIGTHGTTARG
jgi:hypothetical protein